MDPNEAWGVLYIGYGLLPRPALLPPPRRSSSRSFPPTNADVLGWTRSQSALVASASRAHRAACRPVRRAAAAPAEATAAQARHVAGPSGVLVDPDGAAAAGREIVCIREVLKGFKASLNRSFMDTDI